MKMVELELFQSFMIIHKLKMTVLAIPWPEGKVFIIVMVSYDLGCISGVCIVIEVIHPV